MVGWGVYITILGWEKINARKDVENPSWFKFKHKFFDDSEFFDFTHAEKLCWIYFLCEASKKNAAGKFLLSIHHANHTARLDEPTVKSTIRKLKRIEVISVRALRERAESGTYTCAREEKIREEKSREEENREEGIATRGRVCSLPCYASLESVFSEREVSEEIQTRWTEAFPDTEWVVEQIRQALAWESAVPNRKKKKFGAFITGWLTRGWDKRRIPNPHVGQNNYAYRREAGNQHALQEALNAIGEGDDQAS